MSQSDPIVAVVTGHILSSKRELTPHGFHYRAFDGSTYWRDGDGVWNFSTTAGPMTVTVPEWVRACEQRDKMAN